MKIGVIGAGRAGTSIAKYFSSVAEIAGFFSERYEDAESSAEFAGGRAYSSADELARDCDALIISTGDSQIQTAWNSLDKANLKDKLVLHLSGSLSSSVFTDASACGAHAGSLHPAYAFDDRFNSYKGLGAVMFTAEGDEVFLSEIGGLTEKLGNRMAVIDSSSKTLYHAAASLASNHMLGLLGMCADILGECGFTREDAYALLTPLMGDNLKKALSDGAESALTGPIERGDIRTVAEHLRVLDTRHKEVYNALGKQVVALAKKKHSGDGSLGEKYSEIEEMLQNEKHSSDISAK